MSDTIPTVPGGSDSNEWFRPIMELFVTRRRPWVTPVAGAEQFEGNPPLETGS